MREKNDDFAPFQNWLIQQGTAKRTASVYACRVRNTFRACAEITTATLDAYFNEIKATKGKATCDTYYTAWNKIVAYFREKHGNNTIPLPTPRRKAVIQYEIPAIVWKNFLEIKEYNRIKIEFLARFKYGDFTYKKRGKGYEIADPARPFERILIPEKYLVPILDWGNPERLPHIPIFPAQAMARESIPVSHLRKSLRSYKQNHHP